jgi:glyoxylase-like metal-dependent hydrolase (beta-lactamase superfamily II)
MSSERSLPRRQIGTTELLVLSDGLLRIEAERMIGAVPADVAAGYVTADASGSLWLGLGCVLVRTPDQLVLVDTGFGDGPLGEDPELVRRGRGLTVELRELGVEPRDIDLVINTHLHADHAGGNLAWGGDTPRPAFPNAEYVFQERELEWALSEDPRDAMLYEPQEVRALLASRQVRTCDGDVELRPGISLRLAPGHSPGHQVVIFSSERHSAMVAGDLAPLRMHVEHPGYELPGDLDPALAACSRRTFVEAAGAAAMPLVSYHEHDHPFIEIGARP